MSTTALRKREGQLVAVLELPDLPWPELKDAKATHDRLVEDKAETQRNVDKLKKIGEDLIAPFADSLRSGAEYAPDSEVAKLNNEIVALGRRLIALDKAIDDNVAALIETVAVKRGDWLTELDRLSDKAGSEYVTAIDKAQAKHQRTVELKAGRKWVEEFPDQPYRLKTHSLTLGRGVGGSGVGGSEPRSYPYNEIFDSLRQGSQ
jgi:hypothetical protein